MPNAEDTVRLMHMLDHAREASALIRGKSRSHLGAERSLELSLVRLLEIVGEAANRVSASEQSKHPGVPWLKIVGLRNRLIHGYDAVDLDILWEIVTKDISPLIAELEKLVPPAKR